MNLIYLGDKQRSISQSLNFVHFKWIKYSLILGPCDELERWVRLNVAVNDSTKMERQVLNCGGIHHSGGV